MGVGVWVFLTSVGVFFGVVFVFGVCFGVCLLWVVGVLMLVFGC